MSKQTKKSRSFSEFSKEASIHLSPILFSFDQFPTVEATIQAFQTPIFFNLTLRKRFRQINHTLCELIQNAPAQVFLLNAILDFFDRINKEKVLNDCLDLATFEFWLNHFSDLTEQENYEIRAKIVGKYLPREDYQVFFPIGMGKVYSGTHFSTAHLSPDIDTMIASFWGWIDAFGARVGSGLHLWSLPGGAPNSPVTSVFRDMFGSNLFSSIARTAPTLTLTAMDLVTKHQLKKESGQTLVSSVEHGSDEKAIILVNDQGHYVGDWRIADAENVRQIIILFKTCLHWFQNNLHTHLISFFAKQNLSVADCATFNSFIFDIKLKNCSPVKDFNSKQFNHLNDFLHKILGVEKGLNGTFYDLNQALDRLAIHEMLNFQKKMEAFSTCGIFDKKGDLKESWPKIFNEIEELIKHLEEALFKARNYVERLDVALNIKHHVLNLPKVYLTLRSDVDEIQQKIQDHDFLTVIIHEQDGALFPVGIVREHDLRNKRLGTVTLRDFCNLEEVRMASYLEVISIVDHHKSSLQTFSVPTALIGDAQSCNVLVAEQAFNLNDKYSLGGMTADQIEAQIQDILSTKLTNPTQMRVLKRLLQRSIVTHQAHPFYIHPRREFIEYLCFLHAILDDTDLLTKVSTRDLECVAQLLNRLKSLTLKREVEIIHFDDIPRDKKFTKIAAQRILQQADMYALYKQIYSLRELEVESNLHSCLKGKVSTIFLDTKEQNGCARVGQTKMFASNFSFFLTHASDIREIWLNKSQKVYQEKPDITLHLHMVSTIASAEEVYKNHLGLYTHQDELWLWTPSTSQGYNHLHHFLAGFQQGIKDLKNTLSLEFLGPPSQELMEIFSHHFPEISKQHLLSLSNLSSAVMRFKAGALNSRKSMITPYLPRLI